MHVMHATIDTFDALVRNALAHHLEIEPSQIEPSQRLDRDLGLDPLDLVLIALRMEDIEQIEFPIEQLGTVLTVGELTKLLRSWTQAIDFDVSVQSVKSVRPERIRRMRRAS